MGSCLGGGFKHIAKGPGNYVGGGKKNFSKTQGSYATIFGGLNNLVDGNYAIAMGKNALALSNNCMARTRLQQLFSSLSKGRLSNPFPNH